MMPAVETLPAAFAATAHRHRPVSAVREPGRTTSWLRLAQDVRALALGLLCGAAPVGGRRVAVHGPDGADRLALELAILAVGGVVVLDGGAAEADLYAHGLEGLRTEGHARDREAPSAFEDAWKAVDPESPALAAGDTDFTHANVLAGARSLVQALEVDAGDVVRCSVPIEEPAGWVAAHAVPVVTAATLLVGRGSPTILVSQDPDDLPREPEPPARFRRRVTDPGPRHTLVLGHGAVAFPGLAGVACGPDGPLPGVTVAIDDGGEVLVRSEAVPRARCEGGWLRTGRSGDLVDGALVLA
jgi:hypothetical protein